MGPFFQPSFDDLSTPLIDVTFCVLDLETTGAVPTTCEITEIGAVKYRGGELLGTFQTLIDPGAPIPPSITILTGITHAMVVDAPTISEVLPTFLDFIGDSVIVGHNVRFDLSFLNAAAERDGLGRLGQKSSDTASLARRLIRGEVRNLRLKTLASHFRSPTTPNHRALEDARATAHIFHSLLERAGSLGVTNLDDLLQLPTAKGSAHFGKIRLTEALPRSPGVYIFRDRNRAPIYVGKATNLRARVRQYFYGDTRRSIDNMMKELETIEHQVCETTLEAEVAELRLIHAHRPRYNRRSKPPKSSHFVKVTREKFPRLSVVRALKEDALEYLGPFRSKRAADEVVVALWDALPIRRCRGRPGTQTGKCAAAQMGVAQCPCDGSLSALAYGVVVNRLVEGLRSDPRILLEPLAAKMEQMATTQRYEEAGRLRDRHDALARALETRHMWTALRNAGLMVVETESGRRVVVDHGVLVGDPKFSITAERSVNADDHVQTQIPPSVQSAEEARVIWRWLSSQPVRLLEAAGSMSVPITPTQRLRPAA